MTITSPKLTTMLFGIKVNMDRMKDGFTFVGDVPEIKKGFRTNPRYITIEIDVKPKLVCEYTSGKPMKHQMIHTLLLCNEQNWHQLKFIKSRSIKDTQLELDL